MTGDAFIDKNNSHRLFKNNGYFVFVTLQVAHLQNGNNHGRVMVRFWLKSFSSQVLKHRNTHQSSLRLQNGDNLNNRCKHVCQKLSPVATFITISAFHETRASRVCIKWG